MCFSKRPAKRGQFFSSEEMQAKSLPEFNCKFKNKSHSKGRDPEQRLPGAGSRLFATEIRRDETDQQKAEGEKGVQRTAYISSHM